MKAFFAAALVALSLTACASGLSVSQRGYVMCSGYASTLTVLAAHKAELSASVIELVDKVRAELNPICSLAVQSPAQLDQLESGLKSLMGVTP